MAKEKSSFFKLLSLLTYKKPKDIQQFYIPEIDEGNKQNFKEQKTESINKKSFTLDHTRRIKKPIPVSEMKNKENKKEEDKLKNEISTKIEDNISFIKQRFNSKANKDIIIREFMVGGKYKAFITYIDGMVDRITINNFILRPLLKNASKDDNGDCKLDYILNNVLETNQAQKVSNAEDIVYEILSGNTCLYIDGCDYYISNETKGFDKRNVDKPLIEGVVTGSQEAFNETLRTNVTLIRKIIKNSNLTTEFMKLGEVNKNQCAIMYLDGLVNPAIVKEVKRRLKGIKTDMIMGDSFIEQFIEDHPMSIVPTVLTTERPDKTASHIAEGKVAILSEGTPFAIVVPITIASLLHSPEDSYLRWQYGTFLRLIRVTAIIIATLLPGLYMALTNYHREMIPTDLLIAVAKARENVPFPTIVEILVMEISFELIREAGIRIPGIIGNTIGIIGALILGQAAVQANLVSPVMIIIVSVTGLGNSAIPNFSIGLSARIIRLIFIVLGAALGFYGVTLGLVAGFVILSNLKSFGVPYLTLYAPKIKQSNDKIIRKPIWKQELQPDYVNALKVRKQPAISRTWTKENANVSNLEEKEEEDE